MSTRPSAPAVARTRRRDQPAGWPDGYPRRVRLHDGRVVFVRPILPADVGRMEDALRHADAETLRRRFLGGPGPTSPAELRRMVEVDYVKRFAVVAFDEQGDGVGVARYEGERTWPTVELAVVVDPAWRGVGLGGALIQEVTRRAVALGARTATADFYADNIPVRELLSHLGLPERKRTAYGVVEDEISLGAAQSPSTGWSS